MSDRVWYVTANRVPVVWATAVVNGKATVDIFKITDLPGTPNDLFGRFAKAGASLDPIIVERAKAQASTDPVPALFVPAPAPDGSSANRVNPVVTGTLTQLDAPGGSPRFRATPTGTGLNGNTPVAKAAAIAAPTAPGAAYVQAEAQSAVNAINSIRAALTALGVTL